MNEKKRDFILYIPIYLITISIYILAGMIQPTVFSWNNNVNMFTRICPLVLAGLAQTFTMLIGGIDLSIGSIISLTNVIGASFYVYGFNRINYLFIWLLIIPLLGFIIGLINGFIITKNELPPFVVTFATGTVWQGIALFIMAIPGGKVDMYVANFITGKVFSLIPSPLLIFLFFVFISHFVLKKTEYGRSIYAVGGNEKVAVESGILSKKIKCIAYGISGLLSGFAGVFITSWICSGDPLVGSPYTTNSIAVAVIGGTTFAGGNGGVLGIIGGAFIFLLISNILNLLNISTFYQYVVRGLIIIFALIISSVKSIKF